MMGLGNGSWNDTFRNTGYGQPQPAPNSRDSLVVDIINGGDLAAYNYYCIPRTTVFLIDFNVRRLYIKSTDQNCIPQPMKIYSLEEIMQQQFVQENQNGNTVDMTSLQNQIDELKALVLQQNAQLQQAKQQPQFNNQKQRKDG